MYGVDYLYGDRPTVSDKTIYVMRTDATLKVGSVEEPMGKGSYFIIEQAPLELQSNLKTIVSLGFAEEVTIQEEIVKTPEPKCDMDILQDSLEEVVNLSSVDLVDRLLENDNTGAKSVPDLLDNKVSKGSNIVVEGYKVLEEQRTNKLAQFRLSHKRRKSKVTSDRVKKLLASKKVKNV